jgi:hypothetical protein
VAEVLDGGSPLREVLFCCFAPDSVAAHRLALDYLND